MKKYPEELLPCPFCGGKAYEESCDVIIQIGCERCDFNIYGNGYLSSIPSPVEVPVKQKDGTIKEKDTGLYYHKDAHDVIRKRWNARVKMETDICQRYRHQWKFL